MTDTDQLIGQRIKECRKARGLTQPGLAKKIGVVWQQIQKYERGANRVPATRLFDIATACEVPISYFFVGAGEERKTEEEVLPVSERRVRDVVELYGNLDADERREAFKMMTVSQ